MNLQNIKFLSFLFLFYGLSFTLLKTNFYLDNLIKILKEDFKATIIYFLLFFFFLLFLPLIFILIYSIFIIKDTSFFNFFINNIYKLNLGNYKIGFIISLLSIPIILLIQSKQNKEIVEFYPFSKESLKNNSKFLLTETFYLIFYYITWEAVFRGFFQNFSFILLSNNIEFPINNIGNLKSILYSKEFYVLLIGICIQTMLSTLYHIGHPKIEIFASFIGGFIFGIIAFITNSIIYTIFIHSFLGITTDYYIKKSKSKIFLDKNNR